MRSWRMNPLHQGKYLEDFQDDFQKFCIPPNYQERLWAEFNNIQQTVNGRSRDIKPVVTELETLKLRIPSPTQEQLYYQFKKTMDPELHKLISPHIKPSDPLNDMIEMAVKYDSARKYQDSGKPTSNYSRKQNTAKLGNFGKGRYNHNYWNTNRLKDAYNKKNNNTNNNSHPKPSNQQTYHNNNNKQDFSHITCINCNKKGHYANKCPEKSIQSAEQTVKPRNPQTHHKKPFIRSACSQVKEPNTKLPTELPRRRNSTLTRCRGLPTKRVLSQLDLCGY